MNNNKRKVVVFDFDGTLTTRDTLPRFIRFTVGTRRFIIGFFLFLPLMVLMKLKLFDNSRCKELVFSWFFKDMPQKEFELSGKRFTKEIEKIANPETTKALARHIKEGASVYVISASIEEWVQPYCKELGVKAILATKAESNDKGLLTGRFASNNCYGAEKVRRLLEEEPDRDNYHLTAYGDSEGDANMFAFADEHIKVMATHNKTVENSKKL